MKTNQLEILLIIVKSTESHCVFAEIVENYRIFAKELEAFGWSQKSDSDIVIGHRLLNLFLGAHLKKSIGNPAYLVSVERCAHVSDGPMSDVLVSDVLRAMCS